MDVVSKAVGAQRGAGPLGGSPLWRACSTQQQLRPRFLVNVEGQDGHRGGRAQQCQGHV